MEDSEIKMAEALKQNYLSSRKKSSSKSLKSRIKSRISFIQNRRKTQKGYSSRRSRKKNQTSNLKMIEKQRSKQESAVSEFSDPKIQIESVLEFYPIRRAKTVNATETDPILERFLKSNLRHAPIINLQKNFKAKEMTEKKKLISNDVKKNVESKSEENQRQDQLAEMRGDDALKVNTTSMFEENPTIASHVKLVESNFLQKRKTFETRRSTAQSQAKGKIKDQNFLKALRTMRDSLGLIHKKSTVENKTAFMDSMNGVDRVNISEEFGKIGSNFKNISLVHGGGNFSVNTGDENSMETLLNLERYLGELTAQSSNVQSDLIVENEHLPKLRMLLQNMKVILPEKESSTLMIFIL